MRLIGTEQLVVIPVREDPVDLVAKSQWVLLGIRDATLSFQIESSSGEKDTEVPLVRAKSLIGKPIRVPKKKTDDD